MSVSRSFEPWFTQLTGFPPHPWQLELGGDAVCRHRCRRVTTGFGSTAGTLLPLLLRPQIERQVIDAAQPGARMPEVLIIKEITALLEFREKTVSAMAQACDVRLFRIPRRWQAGFNQRIDAQPRCGDGGGLGA